MIQLKKITKKYGENIALNEISLSIQKGMNFMIGASGSGKSSLLKIMSGMDNEYGGDVFLFGKNLKELNQKDKSYLYNNTLGFIWQDFHLLEDYTVMDNVLLPLQLQDEIDVKRAEEIIYQLKLKNVKNKQVKFLSGGQKQRVAIARELLKNPKIILADEPTSALDKQTSKEIMEILRAISKDRMVIVVTHDISHILAEDTVFELDKGELVSGINTEESTSNQILNIKETKLPFKQIVSIVKTNILYKKGRYFVSVLSLLLGVCFLLTTVTDTISNTSKSAYQEVFDMYGEQVLNIELYNSFTGAAGTEKGSNDKPNGDVNQDVSGMYNRYKNDERIALITYVESFDNISIQDGNNKYKIQNSGNVPVLNRLVAGKMPNGTENEVVVPESLVKDMGQTIEQVMNKEIIFHGDVREWNNDILSLKPASIKVKIVGVIDANMIFNYEGQKTEYTIEDSFFFSESALKELLENSNNEKQGLNILMRAKTPSDMIAIKDELNKQGLVPTGNFEVIEDIVRLSKQSTEQSSTASFLIAALAFVMIAAISFITSVLRKKEYAIFKVSGFSNKNLRMLNAFESFTQMLCSLVVVIMLSPLINTISEGAFHLHIITFGNLGITILLLFIISMLSFMITEIICETTSILKMFKIGEK